MIIYNIKISYYLFTIQMKFFILIIKWYKIREKLKFIRKY